jgi:hypothetical protein
MHDRNRQPARLAWMLAVTTVLLGALGSVEPLGANGAGAPSASSARTVSVNERGQLHLLSKHGFTLNEQGTGTGTISGTINVRLTIASTSRVTADVTVTTRGGSISGYATAGYHKGETSASFSGSLSVTHGSGSYARAQGSGLSFSGTIAQSSDAISVRVSGRFSD